jgi:hypothetical protein
MAGYGTNEGFTAYATAAGYVIPEGTTEPQIAAARQRGSVYIDGTYGSRFPGVPTEGAMQDRAWPRTGATDIYGNTLPSDTVPQRVIDASFEATFLSLTNPAIFSGTYTPGTQKVLTEVKGIKWEVIGNPSADGAMIPISSTIEGILAPLLALKHFPAVLVV